MQQFLALTCSFIFMLANPAYSQATRYENQAIRCSGIYWVLTGVRQSNPDLGSYFTQIEIAYSGLYADERQKRGLKTTNGDIRITRDTVLKELVGEFRSKEESVKREINLCLLWTNKMRQAGGISAYSEVFPNEARTESMGPLLDIAFLTFTEWVKSGARTTTDTVDQIRRGSE